MHVLLAQSCWAPRHSTLMSGHPRAFDIQTTWDLDKSIAPSLASLRPLTLQILPVRLLHFILGVQVCTASHQYFDRVDFKGGSSCRISFTYVRRNAIPILVEQEVVGRKLLYAHAPLSFPVELYSMYRRTHRSWPVCIGLLTSLVPGTYIT